MDKRSVLVATNWDTLQTIRAQALLLGYVPFCEVIWKTGCDIDWLHNEFVTEGCIFTDSLAVFGSTQEEVINILQAVIGNNQTKTFLMIWDNRMIEISQDTFTAMELFRRLDVKLVTRVA